MCQDFFCFFKNVTHDILLLHIFTILPDDCQMENQPHHWTNNVYLFNTFISFLFTHPMWDVTDTEVKTLCTLTISTHTSHVRCDEDWVHYLHFIVISTHTSRVGCDSEALHLRIHRVYFYSHIPCGMWPIPLLSNNVFWPFLLTHPVWDVTDSSCNFLSKAFNFYSHIPCGMWQLSWESLNLSEKFLLTHPVWDVTWYFVLRKSN